MQTRRWLYRQLAVAAWDRSGCSPVNRAVIVLILLNLALQILETEPELSVPYGSTFALLDWIFVAIFSAEYLARLWVAGENPRYAGALGRVRYVFTFFALVDLIAILPAYLSLGTFSSSSLRALRLLRVLRFARFGAFSVALRTIAEVVRARAYELTVSVVVTVGMLLVAATSMYFAEGASNPEGFGSIPRALWWSVVTMTTVGYGDITPMTAAGKVLAGVIQLISIAIVAIPTGILAAAFVDVIEKKHRPPAPPSDPHEDGLHLKQFFRKRTLAIPCLFLILNICSIRKSFL